MEEIISTIVQTVADLGYAGVFVLMLIESSFIPFPSEVIMIPAGYLAYQGEMNFAAVVVFAILGSIAGALINYYLALFVGRRFLKKYGKYFFIRESALTKTEKFFQSHGSISTFNGRLIPGIRQLISIPAGLARMQLGKFIFFTSLGAGIWVTILTSLGYFIGQNQDLIQSYLRVITIITIICLVIVTVFYVFFLKYRKK